MLLELVVVIAVLAILMVTATLMLRDSVAVRASALARVVRGHMAYAQELAMARHLRHRVYFNAAPAPVPAGYAVVNDANGNGIWGEAGELAHNPAGGGLLSVTLNAGAYAGITISAVGFSGSYVEFDTLGIPYSGSGILAVPTTVTVSGGTGSQTVSVAAQTGRVGIP